MSRETLSTLRECQAQGFAGPDLSRNRAWWRAAGDNHNLFPYSIPEDFLASEIFFPIAEREAGYLSGGEWVADTKSKMLVKAADDTPLAMVKSTYTVHQYAQTLLGMGLPSISAGVLKGGTLAYHQMGNADEVTTPEGVKFSLKVLVSTSCDGSTATDFRTVRTLVVCDNTHAAAMAEKDGSSSARRVRHTRNSVGLVNAVRAEFGLAERYVEGTIEDIDELVRVRVTDAEIDRFIGSLLPVEPEMTQRSVTIAANGQEAIREWLYGPFADYRNTAFGVLQAVDSAVRWNSTVRGATRLERNLVKTIGGDYDKAFNANRERLLQLV